MDLGAIAKPIKIGDRIKWSKLWSGSILLYILCHDAESKRKSWKAETNTMPYLPFHLKSQKATIDIKIKIIVYCYEIDVNWMTNEFNCHTIEVGGVYDSTQLEQW